LLLRKISKFDATRYQILKLKCTKFDFLWGSTPDPAGVAYSAPPDPLAVFKEPTSKGRERKWRGKGRGDEGKRSSQSPNIFGLEPPLEKVCDDWKVCRTS